MFCSQCGTVISKDAKFCHKCGTTIVYHEAFTQMPNDTTSEIANNSNNKIKPNTKLTKKQIAISAILLIMLIGLYASVIIPALAGVSYDAQKQSSGILFGSGVSFWYFWKIRNRKGWIGALTGIAISLLIILVSGGIAGYLKGQKESYKKNLIESGIKSCISKQKNYKGTEELGEKIINDYCTCSINFIANNLKYEEIVLIVEGKYKISDDIIKKSTEYCEKNL